MGNTHTIEPGGLAKAGQIIQTVARCHGLAVAMLLGERRSLRVSQARQEAMFVIRACTGLTLEEIGDVFGGRHHTTVNHALGAVNRRRLAEPNAHEAIMGLVRQFAAECESAEVREFDSHSRTLALSNCYPHVPADAGRQPA